MLHNVCYVLCVFDVLKGLITLPQGGPLYVTVRIGRILPGSCMRGAMYRTPSHADTV